MKLAERVPHQRD